MRLARNDTLHADHRRQPSQDFFPSFALVDGAIKLAVASAEVDADRIERVGGQGIAQDGFVSALLRQATRQRLPGGSGIAGAVNAQAALGSAAELVGLDGKALRVR